MVAAVAAVILVAAGAAGASVEAVAAGKSVAAGVAGVSVSLCTSSNSSKLSLAAVLATILLCKARTGSLTAAGGQDGARGWCRTLCQGSRMICLASHKYEKKTKK